MRVCLIQIRPDPLIRKHEFELIVQKSGLPRDAFVVTDATEQPVNATLLDGVDALMVGGSGDYLISRGDVPEILEAVCELLREARRRSVPTLGICFGGQLMTKAFGGRVGLDEERAEVGTFLLTATEEGKKDPLFSLLPGTFEAQEGHKDHFMELPPGAVLLASSEKQPNQAFTFAGEPLYALQFHPELDEEAMTYRVDYYATEYRMDADRLAQMHAALRPSPESSRLISLFFEKVVHNV